MEASIRRGRFLTIEGTDGAGKSTQIECLKSILDEAGINYLVTREPGGSALGERLRDVLLNQDELNISPRAQLLIVFAARAQHLEEVIVPALEAGTWVVCDRFTDASYAYQGGAGGISFDAIEVIEDWVQQGLRPDLTLLLDVPVETGQARISNRGEPGDRFEQQNLDFKNKIRQAYLDLADLHSDRIRVIDASLEIETVSEQIRNVMNIEMRQWHCIPG